MAYAAAAPGARRAPDHRRLGGAQVDRHRVHLQVHLPGGHRAPGAARLRRRARRHRGRARRACTSTCACCSSRREKRDEFLSRIATYQYTRAVNETLNADLAQVRHVAGCCRRSRCRRWSLTGRYDINVAPSTAWKIHKAIRGLAVGGVREQRAPAVLRGARAVRAGGRTTSWERRESSFPSRPGRAGRARADRCRRTSRGGRTAACLALADRGRSHRDRRARARRHDRRHRERALPRHCRSGPRLRVSRPRAHGDHEPDRRARGLRHRQRDGLGRALRAARPAEPGRGPARARLRRGRARLRRRDRLHPEERVRVHRAPAPRSRTASRRTRPWRSSGRAWAGWSRATASPGSRARASRTACARSCRTTPRSGARTSRSDSSTGWTSSPGSRPTRRTSAIAWTRPPPGRCSSTTSRRLRRRRPARTRCARGSRPTSPRSAATRRT